MNLQKILFNAVVKIAIVKNLEVKDTNSKYKVHRFNIKMTEDHRRLEQFLNGLGGELISIIPNVTPQFTPGGMGADVDFLYIVEKIK